MWGRGPIHPDSPESGDHQGYLPNVAKPHGDHPQRCTTVSTVTPIPRPTPCCRMILRRVRFYSRSGSVLPLRKVRSSLPWCQILSQVYPALLSNHHISAVLYSRVPEEPLRSCVRTGLSRWLCRFPIARL